MKIPVVAAAIVTLVFAASLFADDTRIVRENIEWCDVWMPDLNHNNLPRVLLIGDSITRAYYPAVQRYLNGKAYCARVATSKSVGDPALLAEIAAFVSEQKFDVIHFNNGMHGWGYTEEQYRAAFPQFVEAIRRAAPQAKLVWADTTPVRNDDPKNARINVRNQIAEEYAKQNGIPIDDQHALMLPHPELHSDDIHFNPVGSNLQAKQVADSVLRMLP